MPELESEMLVLLDSNVYLNNHHPVFYTLYTHICLMIGKTLFDSYNLGLFLVSMIQMIFAIATIAYLIDYMVAIKMSYKVYLTVMLYYVISPRVHSYMFLFSKEVLYSYSILFLIVYFSKHVLFQNDSTDTLNRKQSTNIKKYIVIFLIGCVILFLRKEGKYIILIWFALMSCTHKKSRKVLTCSLISLIIISSLISGIVMPYFKITQGSIREMLSIPFQQTARYVLYYGDEVTEYERETISKILEYDVLAERYNPTNSDKIKNKYNKYATKDELQNYFEVWAGMFLKHPMVYIDATLNNYFYYFYPGSKLADNYSYEYSGKRMKAVNGYLENVGMDIHYLEATKEWQTTYEKVREKFFEIPFFSIFKCAALYVWIMVFFVFYFLWSKKYVALHLVLPLLFSLCIALLGPRNGDYFRYVYVIAVGLPAVVTIGMAYNNLVFDEYNLMCDKEE